MLWMIEISVKLALAKARWLVALGLEVGGILGKK